jgi:FkbM family methyltransferase
MSALFRHYTKISVMDIELLKIRLHKICVSVFRPSYWTALFYGVTPTIEHRTVLRSLDVDGIIDVGANRGQFTLVCRIVLPGVPILAFEPIPVEAATFRKVHGGVPHVALIESALGETTGLAILHLSKSADSSSLLPIGRRQAELFRDTVEVGTIEVPVQRLDDLVVHWTGRSRQLLKLDVQGFELNVLRGAVGALRDCAYIYAECSEVVLYEGQALRAEVEAFLHEHGFARLGEFNLQHAEGRLVQADYLFGRKPGV